MWEMKNKEFSGLMESMVLSGWREGSHLHMPNNWELCVCNVYHQESPFLFTLGIVACEPGRRRLREHRGVCERLSICGGQWETPVTLLQKFSELLLFLMTLSRGRSPQWIPWERGKRERESVRHSIGFLLLCPRFTHGSGTQNLRWYSTYCFSHRAYMGHVIAFVIYS